MIDAPLRLRFRRDWLMRLIGLYALLVLISGVVAYVVSGVTRMAVLDGVLLDLRFLLFFVITWLVTKKNTVIFMNWRKLLLGPALAVMAFGLLQRFALPYDVLRHFGYGPDTIKPFETIDQKRAFVRIQSTLRGANPLGAYLAVIITAIATVFTRVRPLVAKLLWAAIGAAGLLTLFYTYSRSAWIGTVVSVVVLVGLGMRHRPHLWRLSLTAVLICALVFAGGLYVLRDNDYVQNTFFHTDEHSRSVSSSNHGHLTALKAGVEDITDSPLGGGTGTAGPASVHNTQAPARIAENYFVQIGQEVGVLGLVLFLAICALLARRLWRRDQDSLSRVLLSSLIGISVIGLFAHVWTDDTLAYVWWGFAGVAIARVKERKNEAAD
jgi:hypothetical protein